LNISKTKSLKFFNDTGLIEVGDGNRGRRVVGKGQLEKSRSWKVSVQVGDGCWAKELLVKEHSITVSMISDFSYKHP